MCVFKFTLIFVLISFLISCGILAPFKERDIAIKQIKKAGIVEAQRYASNEYNASKKSFEEGQNLIVSNKKSLANKKSKIFFEKANNKGILAYNNAIKPYTQSLIDIIDKLLEKAKQLRADNALKEDYMLAQKQRTEIEDLYQKAVYESTIEKIGLTRLELENIIVQTEKLKAQSELAYEKNENIKIEAKKEKAHVAVAEAYQKVLENTVQTQVKLKEGYYKEATQNFINLSEEIRKLIEITLEKRKKSLITYDEAEEVYEEVKIKVDDFHKKNTNEEFTNIIDEKNKIQSSDKRKEEDKTNSIEE